MSASRSTSKPVTVPSFLAVSDRDVLDLVAAVVGGQQRLRAGLGPLDRLAQLPGDGDAEHLLGRAPAACRRTRRRRPGRSPAACARGRRAWPPSCVAQDVRDLRGRPDGDLLAGRVDDHRARLHERRDQPLLAEPAPDDDRVGVGLGRGDRLVGARRRCPRRRSRTPRCAFSLVPRSGCTQGGALGERRLHVEHGRQVVVVDLDELGGVPGRRPRLRATTTATPSPAKCTVSTASGGALRGLHVRGDRPGAGQADASAPRSAAV